MGVSKEDVACKGCRQQDGKHYHLQPEGCATLDCVKAKGVEFCCDCDDFPCAFLAPTADGAPTYPHNMKVYNLCRIKNFGLEHWIEEVGKSGKDISQASLLSEKGRQVKSSRRLSENSILFKLFVIVKKIMLADKRRLRYQLYDCAYFFEKPRF